MAPSSFGAEAFGRILKIFHLAVGRIRRCTALVNVEAALYRVDFFAGNGHGPDVLFLRALFIDVKPRALVAYMKILNAREVEVGKVRCQGPWSRSGDRGAIPRMVQDY